MVFLARDAADAADAADAERAYLPKAVILSRPDRLDLYSAVSAARIRSRWLSGARSSVVAMPPLMVTETISPSAVSNFACLTLFRPRRYLVLRHLPGRDIIEFFLFVRKVYICRFVF